jgi:hypothetical protein
MRGNAAFQGFLKQALHAYSQFLPNQIANNFFFIFFCKG